MPNTTNWCMSFQYLVFFNLCFSLLRSLVTKCSSVFSSWSLAVSMLTGLVLGRLYTVGLSGFCFLLKQWRILLASKSELRLLKLKQWAENTAKCCIELRETAELVIIICETHGRSCFVWVLVSLHLYNRGNECKIIVTHRATFIGNSSGWNIPEL